MKQIFATDKENLTRVAGTTSKKFYAVYRTHLSWPFGLLQQWRSAALLTLLIAPLFAAISASHNTIAAKQRFHALKGSGA